jgi:hypothetical protein
MRTTNITLAAILALTLSSGFAATHAASNKDKDVTSTPPRASTTGMANRSSEASKHGANQKGFCPPGQFKKPGKGSAFRC